MASKDENVEWLNQYRVPVWDLRQFLAGIQNEGSEEIGAGDLVLLIKGMSRVETSPLRQIPPNASTPK